MDEIQMLAVEFKGIFNDASDSPSDPSDVFPIRRYDGTMSIPAGGRSEAAEYVSCSQGGAGKRQTIIAITKWRIVR